MTFETEVLTKYNAGQFQIHHYTMLQI